MQERRGDAVAVFFFFNFLEREREHLLYRVPANRTISSRQNKQESCFMRRGLRVGTNLVEFQQIQEVGIFSYLR